MKEGQKKKEITGGGRGGGAIVRERTGVLATRVKVSPKVVRTA